MARDGIISLGAQVDKTGVDTSLASIKDGTAAVVQNIAVQVEETCAKTRAAWNKLGDDVKVASQSVSLAWKKAAEDARILSAAQMDLRRATVVTKDSQVDAVAATSLLAAAQQKVAAATVAAVASMNAAKQEAAVASVQLAEEEALSQNLIVRAFQRSALAVKEPLSEVQEKLVATAETSNLTAEGMTAGFAGLGKLVGLGILATFGAHFMDETAHANKELGDLAEKSGLASQYLAGLQGIVRQLGDDWEAISTGLIKMSAGLSMSREPSYELKAALAGVGIRIQELRGLKPEEQLERIAYAFAHSSDEANRAAAAKALFGKSGAELIPILSKEGENLRANVLAMQQQVGVTDRSIAEAERWQQNMANVSRTFQRVGNVLLENMHYVEGGLLAIWETISTIVQYGIAGLEAGALAVAKVGITMSHVISRDFGKLEQDSKDLRDSFVVPFQETTERVKKNWEVVASLFKKPIEGPKISNENSGFSLPKEDPLSKVSPVEAALVKMRHELYAKIRDVVRSGQDWEVGQEVLFWKDKLSRAHEGSELYKKIEEELTRAYKGFSAARIGTVSPDISKADTESGQRWDAEAKAAQEAIKEQSQAYREGALDRIRIAQEAYAQVERNTEFEVRSGRMTQQQRLEALRQAAAEEQRVKLQESQFLQALDMGDVRRYAQDIRQEEQIRREFAQRILQINQQGALQTQQSWQRAFDGMNAAFARSMSLWATGQQTLAQSFGRTLAGMTQTVMQNLLQQAAAFVTHAATLDAIDQRQKLKDAAAAARKTWIAVSAIPIVGPFLAPPAAAAAFAAVEAFDQGGIVGQRMGLGGMGNHVPVLAEAGERILDRRQTANFERLVNQTSSSTSHITNNFHDNSSYSGLGVDSVRGMVRAHGREWRRQAVRELRQANAI